MADGGKLYSPPGYPRSWRALIAAKYSKAKVEVVPYVPGETNSSEIFLSKFPPSEVPVFESNKGECLFDANAIAYFLGNERLRGGKHEVNVTQWVNFAESHLAPAVAHLVYPCLGVTFPDKKLQGLAKQADITVFTALYLLMTHVYDEPSRSPFPHVVRWYLTIGNQPEVSSVVGKVELCVKPTQCDQKKIAESTKKTEKSKGKSPKDKQEDKAKSDVSASLSKKAESVDDDMPKEKPPKNPLACLPTGTFNMDEFKRTYSNNDVETVGLPYLWEHFDAEHYSIWECTYKYPEELRLVFMSSNLIGGVFQRLEKMLKFGFASMCVLGKDKENTIKGVFIWIGTGLIMELDEDLQIDYESFDWKKLDHTSDATKKIVHDFFIPVEEIDGKPVAAYKIFK